MHMYIEKNKYTILYRLLSVNRMAVATCLPLTLEGKPFSQYGNGNGVTYWVKSRSVKLTQIN